MKLFRKSLTLYEAKHGDTIVQVLQRGDKRELRFGNYITQSAILEKESDHLLLEYTKGMMTGLLFHNNPENILHIGLGAGSMPRFIHKHFPEIIQSVIEINPEVIKVAYQYFQLPDSPSLQVIEMDGRKFVEKPTRSYDLIFLDAFLADGAPDEMNTEAFLDKLAKCLKPRGWLVKNVWGSDLDNLNRVKKSLAHVFNQFFILPIGFESNVIVFASNSPQDITLEFLFNKAEILSDKIPFDFVKFSERISCAYQTT